MPSIGVDSFSNMAIGYSASSATLNPSIRYAGRLPTDPPNDLGQGEAILIAGAHQMTNTGRWGDYSGMGMDPADSLTFTHQRILLGDERRRVEYAHRKFKIAVTPELVTG
jgi:hypothetical protein